MSGTTLNNFYISRLGDPVLGITSGSGSLQAAGFALSGPTSIEGMPVYV